MNVAGSLAERLSKRALYLLIGTDSSDLQVHGADGAPLLKIAVGFGGAFHRVAAMEVRNEPPGACGGQGLLRVGSLLGEGFRERDAQRTGHGEAAPSDLAGVQGGP